MIRSWAFVDGKVAAGGRDLAEGEGARWVDLEAPAEEELHWLRDTYSFHPLAIEDCIHLNQRPKLEEFPEALFIVLHSAAAAAKEGEEIELRELHVFLMHDTIVTVHDKKLEAVDALLGRIEREPVFLGRSPDALLHVLCDTIVDGHFPLIDGIHEAIDDLEEQVLGRPEPETLQQIFELKRALVRLRRTLAPQRDVFLMCARGLDTRICERVALYFRDVYDHAQRNTEAIDSAREVLTDVLSAYLSAVANRTNDIMKALTLFSAIFLPLGFLTGFFGMNFDDLPIKSHVGFAATLAVVIGLPVGMVIWFRRQKWM